MTQGYMSNVPISIDTGLLPTTNNLVPSQLAVKTYVDAQVGGAVASVSGTTNRISSTGGTTPVIDIDAAYVGQASLTTLGTVTTGVWTGTTIVVANGGTGTTTLTDGGILLGSGTGAITPLAQATNGQLVIGSTGADPVLAAVTSTDGSLTITNGAGTVSIESTLDYKLSFMFGGM